MASFADHVPVCSISCCPRQAAAGSFGQIKPTDHLRCIAHADSTPRLTASFRTTFIFHELAAPACPRNTASITQNQAPSQLRVLSSQSSWHAAVADAGICGKHTCWHVDWEGELGPGCSGQSGCQKTQRKGTACWVFYFLFVTSPSYVCMKTINLENNILASHIKLLCPACRSCLHATCAFSA